MKKPAEYIKEIKEKSIDKTGLIDLSKQYVALIQKNKLKLYESVAIKNYIHRGMGLLGMTSKELVDILNNENNDYL